MRIQTERLLIRTYLESDFSDIYEIYGSQDNCRYLPFSAWTDESAKDLFTAKCQNRDYTKALNLAVVYEGKVIGDLVVRFEGMKDTYEIGYGFNTDYHGMGLASESCRALVDYLFTSCHAHRLVAYLDARNEDSAILCERLGMRKEAHFIQDYWNKGEWTDSFVYCLLRESI